VAPLVVLASIGLAEVILVALYFAPEIAAFAPHHHNQWAIFALNLLLGWTILTLPGDG